MMSRAQNPPPDTAPHQLPAHTAWLLPPTFSRFCSGCVELGGTRVQHGLKLHCLALLSGKEKQQGHNGVVSWGWAWCAGTAQSSTASARWPCCLHGLHATEDWGLHPWHGERRANHWNQQRAKRLTMTVLKFIDFYFCLCTEHGCDCNKASNALLNSS